MWKGCTATGRDAEVEQKAGGDSGTGQDLKAREGRDEFEFI